MYWVASLWSYEAGPAELLPQLFFQGMALFWAYFWRKGGTENGLYAILGHHIRSLNLVQLFSLAGEET